MKTRLEVLNTLSAISKKRLFTGKKAGTQAASIVQDRFERFVATEIATMMGVGVAPAEPVPVVAAVPAAPGPRRPRARVREIRNCLDCRAQIRTGETQCSCGSERFAASDTLPQVRSPLSMGMENLEEISANAAAAQNQVGIRSVGDRLDKGYNLHIGEGGQVIDDEEGHHEEAEAPTVQW